MPDDLRYKGSRFSLQPPGLIPLPEVLVYEHPAASGDDKDYTLQSVEFEKDGVAPRIVYVTGFSFFVKDDSSRINYNLFGEAPPAENHQLQILDNGERMIYHSDSLFVNRDFYTVFDAPKLQVDEAVNDDDKEALFWGHKDFRKNGVTFPKLVGKNDILRLTNGAAGLGNKGVTWKLNLICFYQSKPLLAQ